MNAPAPVRNAVRIARGAVQRLAARTVRWRLVTALLHLAIRVVGPRNRVGVLALVRREGELLVGSHVFRPHATVGFLGGYLEVGEDPAQALLRELAEELPGARATIGRLLTAAQDAPGGGPATLSLVYECTIEGALPASLPFELLSVRWLPIEEARRVLRPLERRALDLALAAPDLALRSPRGGPMPDYIPSPAQWVRDQVELYERTNGAEGNTLRDTGFPVVIVTNTGNRTGAVRKTPLMRVVDGARYVLVGSRGGAPEHPQWVHNLRAQPLVEVRDLAVVRPMRVRELEGAERDRAWALAVEAYPPYAEYQQRTDRLIPVFLAEPVEA